MTVRSRWQPIESPPTLAERGAQRWKRLKSRSRWQALWAWLRDYPRRTWLMHHAGHEGTSVTFSRNEAERWAADENRAGAESAISAAAWYKAHYGGDGVPKEPDPDELATVSRGPFMRPSEVDALPEM